MLFISTRCECDHRTEDHVPLTEVTTTNTVYCLKCRHTCRMIVVYENVKEEQ
jgi:hypothetical protein